MVYSINGNFGGFQIITVSFDARSSDLIKALCRVYEGQHGLAKCLEGRGAVMFSPCVGSPVVMSVLTDTIMCQAAKIT